MSETVIPLLSGALLLGFLGSVHCLAMCGGIAGALGQAQVGESSIRVWWHALLYSAGRIASYALAGAAVGSLGEMLGTLTHFEIGLRFVAGILILLFGLHVGGWWNGMTYLERSGLLVWRRIAPIGRRLGRPDRGWKVVALGMLWGWLPCGLVYSALAGAAASGSMALGVAFMIAFGAGTLPALVPASALSSHLGDFLAQRATRRIAGAILLLFGLWSIGGAAMPLLGSAGHHAGHTSVGMHEESVDSSRPRDMKSHEHSDVSLNVTLFAMPPHARSSR